MASPHVTGVAALIIEAHGQRARQGGKSLDPDTVRQILMTTATDHACPAGGVEDYTDEGRPPEFNAVCDGTTANNGLYGEGIVNADAAVAELIRFTFPIHDATGPRGGRSRCTSRNASPGVPRAAVRTVPTMPTELELTAASKVARDVHGRRRGVLRRCLARPVRAAHDPRRRPAPTYPSRLRDGIVRIV